jgi:hypothetical protein
MYGMREQLQRSAEEIAEDEELFRRYGAWSPLDPPGLAELMSGFERPWWVVGGWAIEALTGAPREHEDIDLSILACDIPALRKHVGDRWHLWSNDGGTLRPLNDRFPDVLNVESQIWCRASAQDPWVLDLPITPDRDGLWTNKRLPDHVVPVEEATWVAEGGIRYLRPEIVLLYKAVLQRPKDDRDLGRTWPLLGEAQREWLRSAVRHLYPEHRWLSGSGNSVESRDPSQKGET